ncbi:hypothetical protein SMD10_22055 [Consotaella sp. CSK11QG-6]
MAIVLLTAFAAAPVGFARSTHAGLKFTAASMVDRSRCPGQRQSTPERGDQTSAVSDAHCMIHCLSSYIAAGAPDLGPGAFDRDRPSRRLAAFAGLRGTEIDKPPKA